MKNAQGRLLRYDVGVDANEMLPVSTKEIISFFGLSPEGAAGGAAPDPFLRPRQPRGAPRGTAQL